MDAEHRGMSRWWGLACSLLLLLLLCAAIVTRKQVVIWPGNPGWQPYGFSDMDRGGGSRNLFYRILGPVLSSDFILTDKPDRYAGLVLNSADGVIRDCSSASSLRMTYRTRTIDPLRVQILIDAPGRTHPGAELSKRYLFWELPPSLEWVTVDIPLSEFKTPEWWYKQNFVPPALLPEPDYSRVVAFAVCESEFTPPYKTIGVDLRMVAFMGSWWKVILLAILAPLPLMVQWLWKRTRKDVVKPYANPRPVVDRDEGDFERVTELIAQKYSEPELTLAAVSRESRIPESRVSQVLEKRTGLHFKPYLNQVRIQEALRLLQETELTVSEIAFQVGYANTTHFNRVFKGLKQVSPGEFRKAARENRD
jgi:AraC-like DNA-binding protein